jgi:hypothetical protein
MTVGNLLSIKNDFAGLPEKYSYDGWLRYPKGTYEAVLETWVTFQFRTSSRIALIFNIVDSGQFNGKHVPAFFNLKRHKGKTREKGGFIAPPRGDLMDFYYRLNPASPVIPHYRVPLSKLNGLYLITVDDVTKNRKQQQHPQQMIYSRVVDAEPI